MRRLLLHLCFLVATCFVAVNGQNRTVFDNQDRLLDVDGNDLHAVGGGFLQVDDTWYWVGEDHDTYMAGIEPSSVLINMYKSKDLINWEKVGGVIDVYTKDVNGEQPLTYIQGQRSKLLYNEKTKKYVLWVHWEEWISFGPSQVFVATSDNVEGPYTITAKNHHRPGAGHNNPEAMGDRVGQLVLDYNTAANNVNDTTSHPYMPVLSPYPPRILQYSDPQPGNLNATSYVSQDDGYGTAQVDNYWSYQLTDVHFNLTLKARAVEMTAWNSSAYDQYKNDYQVDAATYIVRYPTEVQSNVTTSVFGIGDPGNERQELVEPVIGPTLDESSDSSAVLVNSGDAAFITVKTDNATIYYTTDGSTPSVGTNSTSNSTAQRYWDGTRITVNGTAGTTLTVKAVATKNGASSKVVTQEYEIAEDPSVVPIFNPIINYPSGTYTREADAFGYMAMRIYCPSYNTECYYTMDGFDPEPPLIGENLGYGSRDMTVFVDPQTDEGYLIAASDNVYMRIWKLNDEYTDVVPELEYDVFVAASREAPALIRNGGANGEWVYLVTSTQTGWYPNQSQYVRTRDLSAGFDLPRDSTGYRNGASTWSEMQPFGDPSTWKSQPTYILDIGTEDEPVHIYVGDRWNTVLALLELSRAVFLPLTIDDNAPSQTGNSTSGSMRLEYAPELKINVAKNQIDPPDWKLLSLNKPVTASPSQELTLAEENSGTVNYSASVANDGIAYDVLPYDMVKQYYVPTSAPFFWRVDLEEVHSLSWIGLSFLSVGGSDAVHQYLIKASNDGENWEEIVDNTQNNQPGFMSHRLDGLRYRYIELYDFNVLDVVHNKDADWEVGVYEVSVYGN